MIPDREGDRRTAHHRVRQEAVLQVINPARPLTEAVLLRIQAQNHTLILRKLILRRLQNLPPIQKVIPKQRIYIRRHIKKFFRQKIFQRNWMSIL